MGNIPRSISDYYDAQVVTAYKAPLVGTNLIARGTDLPPGTGTVSRDQVQEFTGKAKRGYRIRTIPRETAERTPKTVIVLEHAYGFDMHKKALEAYGRMGESALNGEDARQAGRLVGESLDDVIFNGDANSGAKGIYKDAGLEPYILDDGKEWNNPT
ncbi:MAG: encapsulin [Smithella sp.]